MAGRTRRVVWAPRAQEGLDEVLDAVLRMLVFLSDLPHRGRQVPKLREQSVREVFVYNYRLMYEVSEAEVRIVAFLHGARDFGRWLRE